MRRSLFILGLQLLAGWQAWSWYARRVQDGSDEPWGLLALLALVLLLPWGARHPLRERDVWGLAAVNAAVALSQPWLPPLVRAAVCLLCVTAIVSRMTQGRAFHLGTWLLALLSLPVLSSVQFYLGYPLRLAAAALSVPMLRGMGLPAVQARGYDDLSAETLARFEAAHVGAVEPGALRAALAASVLALMRAGAEARLPHADTVAQRLAELR